MTTKPRASVVIATRDRPAALRACLQSVRAAMSADDELIVVDSASRSADALTGIARAFGARLLRADQPGSARARNLGAAHASGSFLAFTDDDAVVDAGWLDAHAAAFVDPTASACVGPVFELHREPRALLFSFPDFDPARDQVSFDRAHAGWFARARLGAIGSGANLAVRREVFERVGPFRESLGCGAPIMGDETYFLLSLIDTGGRVVNVPGASVFHPAQSDERRQELADNRAAYMLYVALTRPTLRAQCAKLVVSKLGRARTLSTGAGTSSSLVTGLLRAPLKILQARLIDRGSR